MNVADHALVDPKARSTIALVVISMNVTTDGQAMCQTSPWIDRSANSVEDEKGASVARRLSTLVFISGLFYPAARRHSSKNRITSS